MTGNAFYAFFNVPFSSVCINIIRKLFFKTIESIERVFCIGLIPVDGIHPLEITKPDLENYVGDGFVAGMKAFK